MHYSDYNVGDIFRNLDGTSSTLLPHDDDDDDDVLRYGSHFAHLLTNLPCFKSGQELGRMLFEESCQKIKCTQVWCEKFDIRPENQSEEWLNVKICLYIILNKRKIKQDYPFMEGEASPY